MINIVTLSGHNFPIKIAFHAAARYHDTFFVTGGSNLKSDELDTIYRWGILCIFEILDNFSSQLLRYDVMSDSFTLTEARLPSPITEHSTVMLDNLCTNMTHLSVLKSVLKEVCCIKQFKVLKYQSIFVLQNLICDEEVVRDRTSEKDTRLKVDALKKLS